MLVAQPRKEETRSREAFTSHDKRDKKKKKKESVGLVLQKKSLSKQIILKYKKALEEAWSWLVGVSAKWTSIYFFERTAGAILLLFIDIVPPGGGF